MTNEPVTLFAQTPNLAVVIDVLKKMHAKFTITGPENAWSEIVVTTGGWLRKKQLKLNHNPAYYSGQGWHAQMQGMRGYFSRFPNTPEQAKVLALTGQFGFSLGTTCIPAAEAGDDRYVILSAIAEALDAVWFTPSSLRDAQGRVLYGVNDLTPDERASWPAYVPALPANPVAGALDDEAVTLKQSVFSELVSHGFQPANSLPLPDLHPDARAPHTICARLMSLQAVFAWAAAPEHAVESAILRAYIEHNNLRVSMTESELALIGLPRAEAVEQHAGTVGWKLENIWALAWVVGFNEEPTLDAAQIPDAVIHSLLFEFLPRWDGDVADFAARITRRPMRELVHMEYKFYSAHNAVRSAQLGGATVPDDFDPFVHGGAVHERRHSLTWSLAPGVDWDETDLST